MTCVPPKKAHDSYRCGIDGKEAPGRCKNAPPVGVASSRRVRQRQKEFTCNFALEAVFTAWYLLKHSVWQGLPWLPSFFLQHAFVSGLELKLQLEILSEGQHNVINVSRIRETRV